VSSIAEEYRQKQNKDKVPSGTEAAANNLWEYEKLIDPKFFREERWHLTQMVLVRMLWQRQ